MATIISPDTAKIMPPDTPNGLASRVHRHTNGHDQLKGHIDRLANGNGHINGHANGHINGHAKGNGYINGHVNGNGHIKSNGYTISTDHSVNDYSSGSESHSEPHEHGAAEPIAIIGMSSLMPLVISAECYTNILQDVVYLVGVRPVPNFGIS